MHRMNVPSPPEMGKYIPVQTNRGVTGDVLIEISDKTVLPEIVIQAEQGQTPERRKEDTQRVRGQSKDTDICIGGASRQCTV